MSIVNCTQYKIYIDESWKHLNLMVESLAPSKVFVFVDEHTTSHCLTNFHDNINFRYKALEIEAGEIHKNLDTCKLLYDKLLEFKADRSSLIINLGGGVLGDLGGFVASTFMRGIPFIHIPTTLLSQVDASVGGKLGVDHQGLKNVVGLFKNPKMVFIKTEFLNTLPYNELRSGFAEVIKHALINSEQRWNELLKIKDLTKVKNWSEIVDWNVRIKQQIVEQDFLESGTRKVLNFGHTIGHAIETANLESDNPVRHGEAIAVGMIVESYLSHFKCNLDYGSYMKIKEYILSIYDHLKDNIDSNIENIVALTMSDKKNKGDQILCSLLQSIGNAKYDVLVEPQKIHSSITAYTNQLKSL